MKSSIYCIVVRVLIYSLPAPHPPPPPRRNSPWRRETKRRSRFTRSTGGATRARGRETEPAGSRAKLKGLIRGTTAITGACRSSTFFFVLCYRGSTVLLPLNVYDAFCCVLYVLCFFVVLWRSLAGSASSFPSPAGLVLTYAPPPPPLSLHPLPPPLPSPPLPTCLC